MFPESIETDRLRLGPRWPENVDRLGGRREGLSRTHVTPTDGSVRDEVGYSISQEEWRETTELGRR